MPDSMESVIQQASRYSIQSNPANGPSSVYVVPSMFVAESFAPPWWSPARDKFLRDFWKKPDHLSGTVYTMQSKMTAIPNKVVPRDISIKRYVEQAEFLTNLIQITPGKGRGWVEEYGKWVEDFLTQDNGAFLEVIGQGDPAGPILGQPISFSHLDSYRCQRTGDAIYPVLYMDTSGQRYKLHYTRVMYASQMPSPVAEMYGVGFCAVSRCINVAQSLLDIIIYKQEKLGSRPLRELLITQGGLDPADLTLALVRADEIMDSKGLTRYAKIVIGGSSTLPEADVKSIPLSQLPDGFNEENSVVYGMAAIALAFGVDARELFPAMSSGATRADALLQHLKQRGKGPGQILAITEQMFNYKFLPPYLRFEFDFQDDAQDRQVAEIRQIRANARVQDSTTESITDRVMREKMLEDGDINRSQFERMELEDGRLPDGNDVLIKFYEKNTPVSRMLDIGISDPLNYEKNDPEKMLKTIQQARKDVMTTLANATSIQTQWDALVAKSALDHLEVKYKDVQMAVELEQTQNQMAQNQGNPQGKVQQNTRANAANSGKPRKQDARLRTQDGTSPTSRDLQGGDNRRDGKQSPDDKPL